MRSISAAIALLLPLAGFSADWTAELRPTGYALSQACEAREYDRKCYSHWLKIDGQDVRQWILARDSLIPVEYDRRGKVAEGLWLDPYTARVLRDPGDVDIEHSVALKEAHESGAWKLSPMQKARLANDPDGLYATWSGSNRFKGARSMIEYLPAVVTFIDDYAAKRRIIAERYGLQFSECERLALRHFHGYGKYFERGIKLSKVKAWIVVHRPIFGHRCFR